MDSNVPTISVKCKESLGLDFAPMQICKYLWLMYVEGEVNRSVLKMCMCIVKYS